MRGKTIMQKLFAKLNLAKKNNRGFSLVELIIVIAIMVALVAMLAPQFVKYVAKSRDAVVTRAAEDVLAVAKSEYALGHLRLKDGSTEGKISVQTNSQGKLIARINDGLEYDEAPEGTLSGADGFEEQCGIDGSRLSKSEKAYIITISGGTFTSEETEAVFSEEVVGGGHSDTPVGGD
jgi:prepilin-type N-terminal cleavage/methylation domain-containing protein